MSKSPQTPTLASFRRIVVKVGSSLLVDAAAGSLKRAWLASLPTGRPRLWKKFVNPDIFKRCGAMT